MMSSRAAMIEQAFAWATEIYGEIGVDLETQLKHLPHVPVSLHCWQGDDAVGFENSRHALGAGPAVTGSYPGRARSADELRDDLEVAMNLIPGRHRVNLHASYAETGGQRVERNELGTEHFRGWIDWAREKELGVDFNPTFFAHEKASSGMTLSHSDPAIRRFWIEHGIACRQIGAGIGELLGTACITNIWIPDGCKDTPIDRWGPRERLADSLDEIFRDYIDPAFNLDSVECKLFGPGSESYVVGSHEFYLGYAILNQKLLCLDTGHFHPTELVSDKISAVLQWLPEILLHVSRGVRWDSDHVVTWTDELTQIAHEIVRSEFLDRVHIGLDFFDASINRVAAWVIGSRNMIKALLYALVEPTRLLQQYELDGDLTSRLALLEEIRSLPFSAVWDYYCLKNNVPIGMEWLEPVRKYESDVLSLRNDATLG